MWLKLSLLALLLYDGLPMSQSQVSDGLGEREKRQKEIIVNDILSEESLQPYFPSIVENVTVSHGRKAILKCEVENLRNYKVAWVRVDTQTILTIHNNVITRNPRISLSRPGENKWYLHMNSVQENDRGWYMCQINTDPMVHRSGYLEVVVPPKIIQSGPSDMVVREGENVTLACDANGYPPPHIVWRREDGDDIVIQGKKINIIERAQLRLEKISRLNMGDYLCVASNGIPPSASNRFSVRVQFPPMFWIPSQLEAVYRGQDVTIECHSEAFPKSINYWVNKKGAMLVSNDKYEAVSVDSGYKVFMKLHIRNVSKADFMEYRCVAKNSLGHSDGSITLYEVAAPTKATTTTTTIIPITDESTTQLRRQRQKGRHRKRLRESRRHSYTVEEDLDEEDEDDEIEDNQRIRIIHRERQRQQVQHEGGIDENYGTMSQKPKDNSYWGTPSSSSTLACSTISLSYILVFSILEISENRSM